MTQNHKVLSISHLVEGAPLKPSGPFPKKAAISPTAQKRCTSAVAGVLARFYALHAKNLAVLEELELKETKDQARIDSR
ncbi:hypothetical protein ALP21_200105 [Pseudomonas savastanoi pv. phaseolicola]|uniref:Uncharacterized protein n=2 Tax=Pseudomonas TaxID=286 RepID=A0A7Z6Y8S0_PSESH|nr:hypothetical protein ALP21_200105 [Pseudomonas savastanoi pv. phaseolicola]